MTLRRGVQSASLALFLVLLWLAAYPLTGWLPVEGFLKLDPLVPIGSFISARRVAGGLFVAFLLLVLTAVLGRFFCGYVCPLGTTTDLTDRLIRKKGKRSEKTPPGSLALLKYYVLAFILGAALIGVSFVFLASPLSLITRFYGLVVYPALMLMADSFLALIRPAAESLGLDSLAYAALSTPRFSTQLFIVALFAVIFGLAKSSPRFFCRNLCPSGAMFALFSMRPLIRRRVTEDCTDCGLCQKSCPQGAIPGDDPFATRHSECIACLTCSRVCPTNAVKFAQTARGVQKRNEEFLPERRRLLASTLWGGFLGVLSLTGLHRPQGEAGPGQVVSASLIRPPAALPEPEFLALCVRCGECMKACPTNTLQPVWFEAGLMGLFSPVAVPVVGPCEPKCNVCGMVCPTGAIRPLDRLEKLWAKMGTAYIIKEKCIAWEQGKKCLICDEVCPFDAIDLRSVPEKKVPVPFVDEARCSGCGFCEHRCPVRAKRAIVVEPMAAIRITEGSHREKAREMGLTLEVKKPGAPGEVYPGEGKKPGSREVAPGFDLKPGD